MSYQYDFDHTSAGDLRLAHRQYEILHRAYRLLRDELRTWNQRVAGENGAKEPYRQETSNLDSILKWGERQLRGDPSEIVVRGISVGSLRYAKAALKLDVHQRRQDRDAKSAQGWPDAALRSLDDALERTQRIADDLDQEPSEVLWQLIPRNNASRTAPTAAPPHRWDVFISHASEDKEDFARPLALALQEAGISVWFDEFTLTVGDSLRRSIDRGLASCRFGIVVVSPNFLNKEWPQKELDGFMAREVDGTKVILPVWLDLTADQLRSYSPMLADRVAALASNGTALRRRGPRPRYWQSGLPPSIHTPLRVPAVATARLHSPAGPERRPSCVQRLPRRSTDRYTSPMPTSHVPAIRRTKRTVPASRAHPIRTPHGRRLWWGQTHRNPKHSIPSIVDYAAAVAAVRSSAHDPDAAWWLAETRERLAAATSGVRSWRHADNATREAFLHGLPPRPWTSPPVNPHPDPLVTAYAELLLDYDACVHAAHTTSGYLRRRNLPSNGADHLSREIRIAIANIPRSAMAVAKRLRPGLSEASQ